MIAKNLRMTVKHRYSCFFSYNSAVADKDGVIGKSDLRQTFDALGKMVSDKELDELLGEATVSLKESFHGWFI